MKGGARRSSRACRRSSAGRATATTPASTSATAGRPRAPATATRSSRSPTFTAPMSPTGTQVSWRQNPASLSVHPRTSGSWSTSMRNVPRDGSTVAWMVLASSSMRVIWVTVGAPPLFRIAPHPVRRRTARRGGSGSVDDHRCCPTSTPVNPHRSPPVASRPVAPSRGRVFARLRGQGRQRRRIAGCARRTRPRPPRSERPVRRARHHRGGWRPPPP